MDIADLLARYRADPLTCFSDAEAELLAGAAAEQADAARAAALHAARSGRHDIVLALSRRIAALEPGSASLMNVAIALSRIGRPAEARDWVLAHADRIDPIERAGFLCTMAAYLGDEDEAVRWGNQSLRLRDEAASPAAPLRPVLHRFDPDRPARNIIAFSLWGADPRYIDGALANLQVIPFLYPGWTPRFYLDESVPVAAADALRAQGAQLIRVENLPPERFGLFWRLLVEDDGGVDLYLIRDADAVVNAKERWAVADWLSSGTAFHVMRDHLAHCELMLCGMWGAHRGNIGDMAKRFLGFIAGAHHRASRAYDQEFLRREIWPIARQSLTQHDRCFDLLEPRRFNPDFDLPSDRHIGQNEAGRRRRA